MQQLAKDKALLESVLTYHVIPAMVNSADVPSRKNTLMRATGTFPRRESMITELMVWTACSKRGC
ncbi:MAG: hypothetical protein ACK5TT_07200 [Lysobacteraceae bacterium]